MFSETSFACIDSRTFLSDPTLTKEGSLPDIPKKLTPINYFIFQPLNQLPSASMDSGKSENSLQFCYLAL